MNGQVLQAYDEIMKTNVRAVLQLTMLAAPHLVKTKGNVVNVSSAAAFTACRTPTMISYYVSKAALDHFTRCAALELASSGVRVNSVNPGPVDNGFLAHNGIGSVDKYKQGLIDGTALGYMATDEEIGGVILFLASDKAKSVTGSNYLIENGFLLKN